jgi:hypothetical protein
MVMKKLLVSLVCGFLLLAPLNNASAKVWVNGYFKQNGTYVQGYYRSEPDGIKSNNSGSTNKSFVSNAEMDFLYQEQLRLAKKYAERHGTYKKILGGFMADGIVYCDSDRTKTETGCSRKENKTKSLKAKRKSSLSKPANNERLRIKNALITGRYTVLEDLTESQLRKYAKDIVDNTPPQQILKYAPRWFVAEFMKP